MCAISCGNVFSHSGLHLKMSTLKFDSRKFRGSVFFLFSFKITHCYIVGDSVGDSISKQLYNPEQDQHLVYKDDQHDSTKTPKGLFLAINNK